mmetsp:Transcript_48936/g.96516  ORF Transcript_48936/g.96516 Transcript_48936/m.96516 type:complete len:236 (+) Transcript_48936:149-856(+)
MHTRITTQRCCRPFPIRILRGGVGAWRVGKCRWETRPVPQRTTGRARKTSFSPLCLHPRLMGAFVPPRPSFPCSWTLPLLRVRVYRVSGGLRSAELRVGMRKGRELRLVMRMGKCCRGKRVESHLHTARVQAGVTLKSWKRKERKRGRAKKRERQTRPRSDGSTVLTAFLSLSSQKKKLTQCNSGKGRARGKEKRGLRDIWRVGGAERLCRLERAVARMPLGNSFRRERVRLWAS